MATVTEEKKEVDIYRDTPVRLLGYANEVGEAFRALPPQTQAAILWSKRTSPWVFDRGLLLQRRHRHLQVGAARHLQRRHRHLQRRHRHRYQSGSSPENARATECETEEILRQTPTTEAKFHFIPGKILEAKSA